MKIAIIDDQDDIKYAIEKILKKDGHTCYGFCGDEEDLMEGIQIFDIELIILDMMLENDLTGLDVIKQIKDAKLNIPIIIITAYTTPSNMIEVSKAGIIDIIQKPFSATDIIQTVNKYIPKTLSENIKNTIEDEEFIGSFTTMKEIYKKIGIASKNDSNVLILGETGTGKDLIAKLIHKNSKVEKEPFIAINCASIPQNLFERLMYGKVENFSKYQTQAHVGYVQKVGLGTLYLDEISELHPSLQVQLLRFLETKTFYPLGSLNEQEFKGRVICSSSKSKKELLDSSLFRKELYYRISALEVELPNLQNRSEDINELILYFIKLHCKSLNLKQKNIEKNAIAFFKTYTLKGNIRELKNIFYKIILNSRNDIITMEDIKNNLEDENNTQDKIFDNIVEELINIYSIENSNLILEDFEKNLLKSIMKKENNISKVSNYLDVTRNTLKSKLKKFDLY